MDCDSAWLSKTSRDDPGTFQAVIHALIDGDQEYDIGQPFPTGMNGCER